MKRKNSSDYTIEHVHNFILCCGGIVSGSIIAEYNRISESWAQQCAREAIRRYGDIESISGVGYGRMGIECSYYISASLFAPNEECLYGWEGPVFKRISDYNKALEEFKIWWPPEEEVTRQANLWVVTHPIDTLVLEITLFDGNDEEIDSIIKEV